MQLLGPFYFCPALGVLEPQELILAPVRDSPDELDPVLPRCLVRPGGVLGYTIAELTEQSSDCHALGLGRQSSRNVSCGDWSRRLGEIKLAAGW